MTTNLIRRTATAILATMIGAAMSSLTAAAYSVRRVYLAAA